MVGSLPRAQHKQQSQETLLVNFRAQALYHNLIMPLKTNTSKVQSH